MELWRVNLEQMTALESRAEFALLMMVGAGNLGWKVYRSWKGSFGFALFLSRHVCLHMLGLPPNDDCWDSLGVASRRQFV